MLYHSALNPKHSILSLAITVLTIYLLTTYILTSIMLRFTSTAAVAATLLNINAAMAQDEEIPYEACALIGNYYAPRSLAKGSEEVVMINSVFTEMFDAMIRDGGSEKYGPIFNETTSFSVVLFAGDESVADDPTYFKYHYTSPADQEALGVNVTGSTKFPIGDVTMVFTVYAWLAEIGDGWEVPITDYLPELLSLNSGNSEVMWEEVTVGALAGQASGIKRFSGACDVMSECDYDGKTYSEHTLHK